MVCEARIRALSSGIADQIHGPTEELIPALVCCEQPQSKVGIPTEERHTRRR